MNRRITQAQVDSAKVKSERAYRIAAKYVKAADAAKENYLILKATFSQTKPLPVKPTVTRRRVTLKGKPKQ